MLSVPGEAFFFQIYYICLVISWCFDARVGCHVLRSCLWKLSGCGFEQATNAHAQQASSASLTKRSCDASKSIRSIVKLYTGWAAKAAAQGTRVCRGRGWTSVPLHTQAGAPFRFREYCWSEGELLSPIQILQAGSGSRVWSGDEQPWAVLFSRKRLSGG